MSGFFLHRELVQDSLDGNWRLRTAKSAQTFVLCGSVDEAAFCAKHRDYENLYMRSAGRQWSCSIRRNFCSANYAADDRDVAILHNVSPSGSMMREEGRVAGLQRHSITTALCLDTLMFNG